MFKETAARRVLSVGYDADGFLVANSFGPDELLFLTTLGVGSRTRTHLGFAEEETILGDLRDRILARAPVASG